MHDCDSRLAAKSAAIRESVQGIGAMLCQRAGGIAQAAASSGSLMRW